MRENRPPRGVASLMGLVLSSTLWDMLKRSIALRARAGRARQPVALALVRKKATSMATIKSQEIITTQASRDWEEVVGRGTPKNMVEVAEEAGPRLSGSAKDESVGQAEKGKVNAPLPCVSVGVPPAIAAALKLYKGREVKPGQKTAPLQGAQAGTVPTVPLAQPRQDRLAASARASEA